MKINFSNLRNNCFIKYIKNFNKKSNKKSNNQFLLKIF